MSATPLTKSPSTNKLNRQNADLNRHNMIEDKAYLLASARDFRDGNDLDDWLAAEILIDTELSR
ncbi:MAG: hypothetical protein ACI808_000995 [Paraglaciecola sp.]|jgi:hypothetical protein